MEKEKVAFLGPKGTYTHQATTESFPQKKYLTVPFPTIEDVFGSVTANSTQIGVVPFENSSNGPVAMTLDLLADLQALYPDIVVTNEIYLPVKHCLVGRTAPGQSASTTQLPVHPSKDQGESSTVSGQTTPTQATPEPPTPQGKPLHNIGHVKTLLTHSQAWGQCRKFVSTYLKGAEKLDTESTAKAAEIVSQGRSGAHAAIASKFAGKLYGLTLLAEGIEDSEDNCTRFFVIRRRTAVKDVDSRIFVSKNVEFERYKSLVSFKVDHGAPGSLADSLAVLKKYGLNLTSINTRPSGVLPWVYIFFVEFQGRKWVDGKGGAVNEALAELDGLVECYRWLGSWENMHPDSQYFQGGKVKAGESKAGESKADDSNAGDLKAGKSEEGGQKEGESTTSESRASDTKAKD